MGLRFRWVATLFLTVAVGACSAPPGPPGRSASCPIGPHSLIDRVDFVKLGTRTYVASFASVGRKVNAADLGPPYATVHCTLLDMDLGARNTPQDGDAAFLAPGTPMSRVNGYSSTFRLASQGGAGLTLHEVDTDSAANIGADLLDLAGKVTAIRINADIGDATTTLATISDPASVNELTRVIGAARVDQGRFEAGVNGKRYFLAFDFKDGTASMRAYWPDTGELSRGIWLSPFFRQAIEQALGH
jgi:hypothetical protein